MDDDKNVVQEQTTEQAEQNEEAKETKEKAKPVAKEKTFTQDELNAIVQERVNRAMEKAKADKEEAEKLAKMNAQQRAEHENARLKEELAQLRQANTLSQMAKTARAMLEEKGIAIGDELVQVLITEEAESTKKNVDEFSAMYLKAIENGVNERLKGKTPGRMVPNSMSKSDILAIKNTAERQRAIASHLDLFKK